MTFMSFFTDLNKKTELFVRVIQQYIIKAHVPFHLTWVCIQDRLHSVDACCVVLVWNVMTNVISGLQRKHGLLCGNQTKSQSS